MERIPMTAPGLKALEDEINHLKTVERPSIIRMIAEARAHGDLSENAEYHAAKERQAFNGLAMVIVRTVAGQAGNIVVTAKSDGLGAATSTLKSE